jgi:DNA-binding YbaB/EbfC family protein
MRANIPKGMGGAGNMNAMIRQAQKMQEDMETLQADLDAREYDISAGGGMVKLKINGKREILGIDIDPDIVDPDDVETLADIITAAVNEGIKRVDETNADEMAKITGGMGGLGLPGMF